jgi:hypothetical protein
MDRRSRTSRRAASCAGERASSSTGRGSGDHQTAVQREYVRALLDCYVWLPGTARVASRHDRRCALELHRRGVPFAVVRCALLVATARRTFRRDPLPLVRSLAYFLPAVEEMQLFPCDADYLRYLEDKLRPLAEAKRAS